MASASAIFVNVVTDPSVAKDKGAVVGADDLEKIKKDNKSVIKNTVRVHFLKHITNLIFDLLYVLKSVECSA